jgi:hypothetical protein
MRSVLRSVIVAAVAVTALTAAAPRQAVDLTGTWNYAVVTENGTGTPTVTMKQAGDSLTGTYESGRMGVLAFKGAVKGKEFTFAVTTGGGTVLTFKGLIVDNDHVEGDVDFGGQGSAAFTGVRKAQRNIH